MAQARSLVRTLDILRLRSWITLECHTAPHVLVEFDAIDKMIAMYEETIERKGG